MPANTAIIDQAPELVERDAEGVPVRWRVLPADMVTLHQDGRPAALVLTDEDIRMIADTAAGKPIPVDCDHALFLAAADLGLEESDPAMKQIDGEQLACGHVILSAEPDGLYATVENWVPRAHLLLKEQLYRYFSPVIRGLRDGRKRITSLALTNRPALDGLQPLVLSSDVLILTAHTTTTQNGGSPMNPRLLAALAIIIGANPDALALSDDGSPSEDLIAQLEARAAELPKLQTDHETLGKIRDVLSLSADTDASTIEGKIRALTKAGGDVAALSAEVGELKTRETARERAALIEQGTREGKLTKAQLDGWVKDADVAVLSSYLATAPVVAPTTRTDPDTLAASDAQARGTAVDTVARACGLDPEHVRKTRI